jgi:hypothetical protein
MLNDDRLQQQQQSLLTTTTTTTTTNLARFLSLNTSGLLRILM